MISESPVVDILNIALVECEILPSIYLNISRTQHSQFSNQIHVPAFARIYNSLVVSSLKFTKYYDTSDTIWDIATIGNVRYTHAYYVTHRHPKRYTPTVRHPHRHQYKHPLRRILGSPLQ